MEGEVKATNQERFPLKTTSGQIHKLPKIQGLKSMQKNVEPEVQLMTIWMV